MKKVKMVTKVKTGFNCNPFNVLTFATFSEGLLEFSR
jgi:hypothetical protein